MPKVAYFGERADEFCAVSKLCVTDVNVFPLEDVFEVVVIDGNPPARVTVPTEMVGVVGSDNKKGLECLMRSGVRTVTCGLSRRDTVTLSSSVADITVCLQRRLPTVNSGILEPGEYVVKNDTEDYMLLLLSAATRLLLGLEPI
jgi:hypothetical protein